MLLQTVALFETLLARIHTLQGEAKTNQEELERLGVVAESTGQFEATLAQTQSKLEKANEVS